MPGHTTNRRTLSSRTTAGSYRAPVQGIVDFDAIEKGFDREEILLSINEFAAKNIQSDSRFTEEFIRSRLKKNKGPNLISSELNCRGITEALISENLSKISHDQWLDSAFAALRKKLKGSSIRLEDRDKIYSFLIGRGFEHKMIKYALSECKNEC